MSFRGRVPDVLPFTKADLRLPMAIRKGQRNSISGVQAKVLLSIVDGQFQVVASGGDFILKPVPEDSRSRFAADIPANENVTMQIASRLFRIQTAANKCVRFADGELAYLTRRFDRRDGASVRQEDMCQIAGRSEETHGEAYKYDFSYEEMAELIRMACPASGVELPKVFRQILFDYLFANGDAHLKNFSVYESDLGDYVMTPAYDLLNTDSRMGEAAYWATYCGYRMDDPVLTLRHYELARRDTTKLEYTLQYAAEAWKRIGDEARYGELLWEGFAFFPQSAYFFPRLMDDYTRKGNYDQALMVVDEALKTDSLDELFLFAKSTILLLNELFLFAKSTMLLNLGRYTESLDYSKRLIAVNDQMADAYYNAGTACVNIALGMDSRKQKKQIRKMYQQAQPYMETYRQMVPEAIGKWGPALYRIYFNLNLGKQFDEIDKILKK